MDIYSLEGSRQLNGFSYEANLERSDCTELESTWHLLLCDIWDGINRDDALTVISEVTQKVSCQDQGYENLVNIALDRAVEGFRRILASSNTTCEIGDSDSVMPWPSRDDDSDEDDAAIPFAQNCFSSQGDGDFDYGSSIIYDQGILAEAYQNKKATFTQLTNIALELLQIHPEDRKEDIALLQGLQSLLGQADIDRTVYTLDERIAAQLETLKRGLNMWSLETLKQGLAPYANLWCLEAAINALLQLPPQALSSETRSFGEYDFSVERADNSAEEKYFHAAYALMEILTAQQGFRGSDMVAYYTRHKKISINLYQPMGLVLPQNETASAPRSDFLKKMKDSLTKAGWLASPLLTDQSGQCYLIGSGPYYK